MRKQCLAATWRTMEEDPARRLHPKVGVDLWVSERIFDQLSNLGQNVLHAANVCISHAWARAHFNVAVCIDEVIVQL